jgi:hypothetical protein
MGNIVWTREWPLILQTIVDTGLTMAFKLTYPGQGPGEPALLYSDAEILN